MKNNKEKIFFNINAKSTIFRNKIKKTNEMIKSIFNSIKYFIEI
jgi:hypothetical protein